MQNVLGGRYWLPVIFKSGRKFRMWFHLQVKGKNAENSIYKQISISIAYGEIFHKTMCLGLERFVETLMKECSGVEAREESL